MISQVTADEIANATVAREALTLSSLPAASLNALGAQAHSLMSAINAAQTADDYASIMDSLKLYGALWQTLGYGYKVKDICGLAINALYKLEAMFIQFRDSKRNGSKTWKHWNAECHKIGELIADFCIIRADGV